MAAMRLRLSTALLSDDSNQSHRAERADMGIGLLPAWLVDEGIASGPLVRVLPQWNVLTVTLYAIYTSGCYRASKVRSLVECLSGELANDSFA